MTLFSANPPAPWTQQQQQLLGWVEAVQPWLQLPGRWTQRLAGSPDWRADQAGGGSPGQGQEEGEEKAVEAG